MNSYARLGTLGILSIVALRVCIGWHFYMEGATKVRGDDFSSVGFLNAAKGPLADKFQSLIWDHDGKIRLDQKRVIEIFKAGGEDASKHFGFTEEQNQELAKVTKQFTDKLNEEVYKPASDDIIKFTKGQERIAKMESSDMYQLESMLGQKDKIKTELATGVKPTLTKVEEVWNQYENRLNAIANSTQWDSVGRYRLVKPGQGPLSTDTVDKIIPIFDMVIGILLIIGLLTPVASILAALFLLSVVLTQMPGYPGAAPTYFQAVEAIALLVLAATDAGRYAGLDFLPWAWWNRKAARANSTRVAAAR
jgi:uncharacterized membrane protein YphA (DoxX/SURF4 family)